MFLSFRRFFVFVALGALAACSGQAAVPAGQSVAPPALRIDAKTKVTASPTKLSFTTTPTLKLTISEKNYHGKFKVSVDETGIVSFKPGSGRGPTFKATVTAVTAGKATLTVKDANGNQVTVPVTVTQGVVIIQ